MNTIINQLHSLTTNLHDNLYPSCLMVASLWIIQLVNWLSGYCLLYLGIRPRRFTGLIGIVFAPLLHRQGDHLLANSIPLFVLLAFMLLVETQTFLLITVFIWGISGLLTWLFGRNAIHLGASSVIMGYWGYLLVNAIRQPNIATLIIGLIILYYFGHFLISLLPGKPRVSWEGHLFGCLAGVLANVIFSSP